MTNAQSSPDRKSDGFLRAVAGAAIQNDAEKVQSLIEGLPVPDDIDAELERLTFEAFRKQLEAAETGQDKSRYRIWAFRGLIALLSLWMLVSLIIGGYTWSLCGRYPEGCQQVRQGTYTPTPTFTFTPTHTPTPTPTFTPTFTPTPTQTPTATPTPTEIPDSAFLNFDLAGILPVIPQQGDAVWLLDEDQAEVFPALDDAAAWTIAQNNQAEDFAYLTAGDAIITWRMDYPFREDGLYQLYFLDTMQFSGGAQSFEILLDEQPANAYRGAPEIILNTAQFGKQSRDQWLSLGAYEITHGQQLTVRAVVTGRSEEAPFAIDRLLIVKATPAQKQVYDLLPEKRVLMTLLDDQQAAFFVGQDQVPSSFAEFADAPAWNGSFRSRSQPGQVFVDWDSAGRLPPGQYELLVWVPAQHATVAASYKLIVDGKPFDRPNPAEILMADFNGGWVSLGIWEIPEEATVGVRMSATIQEDGAMAVDAVALVWVGE